MIQLARLAMLLTCLTAFFCCAQTRAQANLSWAASPGAALDTNGSRT